MNSREIALNIVSRVLDEGAYSNLVLSKELNESNLDAIESEEGVEVVRRSLNNEDYYFVLNHTSDEKKFRNEILKAYEAKIVKA